MISGTLNRLRILIALLDEPMHSSQIGDELGFHRPDECFYMSMLIEKGLVEENFKVIEQPSKENNFKGKAGQFFSVTDKGKAYLDFILMSINFYERAWNVK